MTDTIPFVLTKQERDQAALIALELERQRRERNERDQRREKIKEAA